MLTSKIIKRLKASPEYLSGEILSREMGVSRTMVWKTVRQLRQEGYMIASSPRLGYRLDQIPDLLLPREIQEGMGECLWGRPAEYHEAIVSTNSRARELASAGWPEGGIVVAESQTGGRGRLGRQWTSPRGGIWFSVILKPKTNLTGLPPLSLMMAVAVKEAVSQAGVPVRIKWPNDLLLEGKKVAGILTETAAEIDALHYVVIGCGINANFSMEEMPEELQGHTATLMEYLGRPVDRVGMLQAILKRGAQLYHQIQTDTGREQVLDLWRRYNCTIGETVTVTTGSVTNMGTAVGVGKDGALILRLQSGKEESFTAGEVTLQPLKKSLTGGQFHE